MSSMQRNSGSHFQVLIFLRMHGLAYKGGSYRSVDCRATWSNFHLFGPTLDVTGCGTTYA